MIICDMSEDTKMPGMKRRVSIYCCSLILIAGCAETRGRWENINLPHETWAQDEASCRELASQRVTREFGRFEESWANRHDPTSTMVMSLERHEADKRERELLESCMTEKGYVWVTAKGNAE